MDAATVRAALQRYLDAGDDKDAAHEGYAEDAVLEFPQSGERFEGVANFREWRAVYPAEVRLEIGRIRGSGDVWVVEARVSYDGGPWNYGVSIHEWRDGKIARETIYYAEPFEAPAWRAKWRAAPASETAEAGG
jgi:hypothetical protein